MFATHMTKCKSLWNSQVCNMFIFSPLRILRHALYFVSVLNIGLFQFSSKISVTLVSVLFTPPMVNPIHKQLSR